jgi:hypothetical protein
VTEPFALVTAVFGGYDPVFSLPGGVRGICFTDGEVGEGWERRKLGRKHADLSPRRKNRLVKLLIHELVDAAVVLYVDGQFKVTTDPVDWALLAASASDFGAYRHPRRACVYEEGAHCLREGRGDPDQVRAQLERYRAAGLPERSGLWGGGVLLRRMTPAVRAFGEAWWAELQAGSERDQLALGYLAWAREQSIKELPGSLYKPAFGVYRGHPRQRT